MCLWGYKGCPYNAFRKRNINEVRIGTPKGIDLDLKIDNISRGKDWVQCSVKKDGGDDIDATHGMDIFARLELVQADQVPDFRSDLDSDYLFITSGQGIGRVTKGPGYKARKTCNQ